MEDIGAEHLQVLQDSELWLGNDYELGLRMQKRALQAGQRIQILKAIWQHPHLVGVRTTRNSLGQPWQGVDEATVAHNPLYGCIKLEGGVVGCRTTLLNDSEGSWCILGIPMGMLEILYPGASDPDNLDESWIISVDSVLADIGARAFETARFVYGVIGESASALFATLTDLSPTALRKSRSLLVPENKFIQEGIKPRGAQISKRIWWTGSPREVL